jgi:hypothetical protein
MKIFSLQASLDKIKDLLLKFSYNRINLNGRLLHGGRPAGFPAGPQFQPHRALLRQWADDTSFTLRLKLIKNDIFSLLEGGISSSSGGIYSK